MNIIFLTRLNPKDINSWSGTLYYIYNKLKERHNVEIMGQELISQLIMFTKGNFPSDVFIPVDRYVKYLGKLLSERINIFNYDLIFFGDLIYIPLDINIPMIMLSDATYEQVKVHYSKSDERNVEPCINLEKILLNYSFKIIFCSEWIKNRVVDIYNIDPNKIDVVELGANIPTPANYSIDISMDICRLVYIGKDWKRKGGDKVLQIYKILKDEGFPCSLTVIGSTPKEIPNEDKNLTIIPSLDKSSPEHLAKLCNILSEAHFFVLPTNFDAYGIVFCEASAYALPSITANVGGVGQPVKDGRNGFLLPPDTTALNYAEKIKTVFNDKENYLKLRASSRHEFETRLNWDVWFEKVDGILENAVKEWKNTNLIVYDT